ncbi:Rrf2 family transcriptional regulator [Micromonospora sp. PPF5-17]|uniref:Rrf2 family transcriptional regulator n=2 Tax=Micromonosporaceae TaxID=28056 RepID=A0ABX9WD02_9ACTN|nr:Rrf2 family transcriptional regulator [Micromonospora sp. PPF5-17B]NES38064.1 Rrf2 family transcriptional regulator [Micromonospora solifontis]NES56643.1 Rrf2 family transcriptional regulator [Micromonospora sp. PPF5-6]RNL97070.1 Rrf2 family transcriptional regulator [Micromonospora solifontis]
MRMSQGVEWALHTCLNLTYVESGQAVPTAALAKFYALPPAYLNKHLQALVRAGILSSTPGPRGGFRLARRPEAISLLDVVTAIEGSGEAFPCDQILREGPGGRPDVDYRHACVIAGAMRHAELAWRRELAGRSLADIRAEVETRYPDTPRNTRERFAALLG